MLVLPLKLFGQIVRTYGRNQLVHMRLRETLSCSHMLAKTLLKLFCLAQSYPVVGKQWQEIFVYVDLSLISGSKTVVFTISSSNTKDTTVHAPMMGSFRRHEARLECIQWHPVAND